MVTTAFVRPVNVITRACGFAMRSHFSRRFRLRTGTPPLGYGRRQ
jgi:transcriptional regulator GlxA family with amidase domain